MSTVVVGSSIAAVRTVQALRRAGHEDRITLIGAESELPYDKPPLSKGALLGGPEDGVKRLLGEEQARDLDVDLRLGVRADRLDVAGRRVVLADGTEQHYRTAILATGASARRSPWTASAVHVLRTLDDCRGLQADLARGGPVVVIGAGFIGSEVASTCRSLGLEVTLVDPAPVPMARAVGATVGAEMIDLHRRHGAQVRFGVAVLDVTGTRGDLLVHLADGTRLAAATVVVGIGAVTNDGWLRDSGLTLEATGGVVCDGTGATGAPGVFALGDVACWHHPELLTHHRIEHWTNAVDQAGVLAGAITGRVTGRPAITAHRPSHFVWSDQYDWKLHVVGRPGDATASETLRGDGDRFVTAFTDTTGRICGAVVVNWPKASLAARRALAANEPWPDALARLRACA